MKFFLSLGIMLIMATQSGAETYSWIDDNGTYNFTEDLSSVPKKYRKKVNRLGDMGNDSAPQAPATPEKKSDSAAAPGVKPATLPVAAPVEDKQLYNGKSRDAWRQEFDTQEAELKKLEQHLDMLQKRSVKELGMPRDQFAILKNEHDETKAAYDLKYKIYSELIEAARKAGLVVEIKK